MKTLNLRIAAIAIAGAALSTQTAKADPYTDGDLILGFRASGGMGGNTNLLINLGNASIFRDASTLQSLSLGNLDADLDAIYGTGWATRADVFWSISGTQFTAGNGFANRTMFASRAQPFRFGHTGPNSTPWTRATQSTQQTHAGKIAAFGTKYGVGTTGGILGTDQIESTNTPLGLIQPHGQNNSYEDYMPGGSLSSVGSSFGYFGGGGIEGSFANGANGAALDIYTLQPDTSPFDPGVFEGTFTISDAGAVSFTPLGVPEPSSALMLALGGTALGFIRRRQRA